MTEEKQKIIDLFQQNVKGRIPNLSSFNGHHDGRAGHWLEQQFNISANAANEPDLFGYELKNETTSKTTFGDWSANEYIYKNGEYIDLFLGDTVAKRQDVFCRFFGKPNPNKNNRYSWSGTSCPKINSYNIVGQILIVEENLDLVVKYSYSKDQRENKNEILPKELHQENLIIARWFGLELPLNIQRGKCLKKRLEDKFNDRGWFTCKKDKVTNTYNKLCFGDPIDFKRWIELVKQGVVFFDSGMHQGNSRPYSEWRANNSFWDSLIVEVFE